VKIGIYVISFHSINEQTMVGSMLDTLFIYILIIGCYTKNENEQTAIIWQHFMPFNWMQWVTLEFYSTFIAINYLYHWTSYVFIRLCIRDVSGTFSRNLFQITYFDNLVNCYFAIQILMCAFSLTGSSKLTIKLLFGVFFISLHKIIIPCIV